MIRLPPLRCTFATQISLKMSTLDILSSECYDSLQCRRNNKSCETSFRSISHRSQQTGGAIYGYAYNQPQYGTAVQTTSAARRSQKVKPRPSSGILARSYAAKYGERKPVKILDEEYVNSSSISSPTNETEAPGFRHGEEVDCGFNRLQYFFTQLIERL